MKDEEEKERIRTEEIENMKEELGKDCGKTWRDGRKRKWEERRTK